jgi:hypothetical protein
MITDLSATLWFAKADPLLAEKQMITDNFICDYL